MKNKRAGYPGGSVENKVIFADIQGVDRKIFVDIQGVKKFGNSKLEKYWEFS